MIMKKPPLGIDDFEKIRKQPNKLYVDKTALIAELVTCDQVFFTRPRRFGKDTDLHHDSKRFLKESESSLKGWQSKRWAGSGRSIRLSFCQ